MKALRLELLLLLLLLLFVHFSALFTFTKGFITTRVELPHRSQCVDFSSRDGQQHKPAQDGERACWSTAPQHPHRIRKVVLMIVDALRADFYYEPEANISAAAAIIRDYSLHMPRLHAVVQEAGASAFIAPFIADTPTITMSRLKTLLTGTLPTFLDVGSSFSAASLTEDNLLDQLKKKGKRMVFAGDDTWMQLAPLGTFDAAHLYPSFNVHDLHTVDNGVWQYLNHYLAHPESWEFLVGHYLGLDHAGHSRGVASSGMAQKLAQMDAEVDEIARRLHAEAYPGGPHEHTLLVVLGDHGQTLGGDHGGSSKEETDSLIAAINVGKWRRQRQQQLRQQQHSQCSLSPSAKSQQQQQQQQHTQPDPNLEADAHHHLQQQQQQQQQQHTQPDPNLEADAHHHLQQQQQQQQQQRTQPDPNLEADAHHHLQQQQQQHTQPDPYLGADAHHHLQQQQQQQQKIEAVWTLPREHIRHDPPQASDVLRPQMRDVAHVMTQLDFTSTLALLLGLPIPYGNVGSVDMHMWAAAWEEGGGEHPKGKPEGAQPPDAAAPGDPAAAEGQCAVASGGCAAAPGDSAPAEGQCAAAVGGCAGAPGDAAAAEGCLGTEGEGVDVGECSAGAKEGEAPFVLWEHSWRHSFLEALALTSQQVQRYLETYTQVSSLTPRDLHLCSHLFKEAHLAYQAYLRTKQQQQQHLQEGHEQHIGGGQQQQQQQQQQHLQEGQELQTGRGQQQERQGKLEQLEASLLLGREGSETEEGTAQGFGHAFRRPSSEAQMRTDALAGNAALEALYADALAKLQAFQQGAAELARAKFAGSSLPFMVLGCLLMLASVSLHVLVLARVCNAAMLGLPGPRGALLPSLPTLAAHLRTLGAVLVSNPGSTCVPAGMVAFQAASLFGMNWMMGEGRVLCTLLILLQVLLTALAAKAAIYKQHPGRHQQRLQLLLTCTHQGQHLEFQGRNKQQRDHGIDSQQQQAGDCASGHAMQPHKHKHDFQQQKASNTCSVLWRSSCRALRAAAQPLFIGCVAVGASMGMARVGLIDRWGHDPHDKAQVSSTLEDLLGGGGGVSTVEDGSGNSGSAGMDEGVSNKGLDAAQLLWLAAPTVGPLLLLPWLLCWATNWVTHTVCGLRRHGVCSVSGVTTRGAKRLAHSLGEGFTQGLGEGFTQGLGEGFTQGLGEGLTQGLGEGLTQGRGEGLTQGLGEETRRGGTQHFRAQTVAQCAWECQDDSAASPSRGEALDPCTATSTPAEMEPAATAALQQCMQQHTRAAAARQCKQPQGCGPLMSTSSNASTLTACCRAMACAQPAASAAAAALAAAAAAVCSIQTGCCALWWLCQLAGLQEHTLPHMVWELAARVHAALAAALAAKHSAAHLQPDPLPPGGSKLLRPSGWVAVGSMAFLALLPSAVAASYCACQLLKASALRNRAKIFGQHERGLSAGGCCSCAEQSKTQEDRRECFHTHSKQAAAAAAPARPASKRREMTVVGAVSVALAGAVTMAGVGYLIVKFCSLEPQLQPILNTVHTHLWAPPVGQALDAVQTHLWAPLASAAAAALPLHTLPTLNSLFHRTTALHAFFRHATTLHNALLHRTIALHDFFRHATAAHTALLHRLLVHTASLPVRLLLPRTVYAIAAGSVVVVVLLAQLPAWQHQREQQEQQQQPGHIPGSANLSNGAASERPKPPFPENQLPAQQQQQHHHSRQLIGQDADAQHHLQQQQQQQQQQHGRRELAHSPDPAAIAPKPAGLTKGIRASKGCDTVANTAQHTTREVCVTGSVPGISSSGCACCDAGQGGLGRVGLLLCLLTVMVAPVMVLLGSKGSLVVSAACMAIVAMMGLLHQSCADAGPLPATPATFTTPGTSSNVLPSRTEAERGCPPLNGGSERCRGAGSRGPPCALEAGPEIEVDCTLGWHPPPLALATPSPNKLSQQSSRNQAGRATHGGISDQTSARPQEQFLQQGGKARLGKKPRKDGLVHHHHQQQQWQQQEWQQQFPQERCEHLGEQVGLRDKQGMRDRHYHHHHYRDQNEEFLEHQQLVGQTHHLHSQDHAASLVARALPHVVGGACALYILGAAAFFASGHFCEFTGLQYASPFIGFDEMDWRFSPTLLTLNTFGLQLLAGLCVGLLPAVIVSSLRAADSAGADLHAAGSADAPPAVHTSISAGAGAPASQTDASSAVHTSTVYNAAGPAALCPKAHSSSQTAHLAALTLSQRQCQQLVHVGLVTLLCARAVVSLMVVLCATILHGHILVWAIIAPRFVFEICMAATAGAAALLLAAVIG